MQHHAQLCDAHRTLIDSQLLVDPRIRQKIARDCLAKHLWIVHILIEGTDQIIPIPPCIRNRGIAFTAIALCIAHPVHPVACPFFAVARGTQHAIHRRFNLIKSERCHFFDGRRQTSQHIAKPPQHRCSIRITGRGQRIMFPTLFQKTVHGMGRPLRILHCRHRRILHRLKTPPSLATLANRIPIRRLGKFILGGRRIAWIWRTVSDPALKICHDRLGQRGTVLRHRDILLRAADCRHQQRLRRLTRHNRSASFPALLPTGPGIEEQSTLLFASDTVAFIALLSEHRADT